MSSDRVTLKIDISAENETICCFNFSQACMLGGLSFYLIETLEISLLEELFALLDEACEYRDSRLKPFEGRPDSAASNEYISKVKDVLHNYVDTLEQADKLIHDPLLSILLLYLPLSGMDIHYEGMARVQDYTPAEKDLWGRGANEAVDGISESISSTYTLRSKIQKRVYCAQSSHENTYQWREILVNHRRPEDVYFANAALAGADEHFFRITAGLSEAMKILISMPRLLNYESRGEKPDMADGENKGPIIGGGWLADMQQRFDRDPHRKKSERKKKIEKDALEKAWLTEAAHYAHSWMEKGGVYAESAFLTSYLAVEYRTLIEEKHMKIRRCKICDKFFVSSYSDAQYCKRPNEKYDGRKCNEVGPKLFMRENNPFYDTFESKSKTYLKWTKENKAKIEKAEMPYLEKEADREIKRSMIKKEIEDGYKKWRKEAKDALTAYKTGQLSQDELFESIEIPAIATRSPGLAEHKKQMKFYEMGDQAYATPTP